MTSATFEFEGRPIPFRSGQTLASALWASGERVWRVTARGRLPRGYYCGAGFCYECLVVVDGRGNMRACQAPARSGLRVATQDGFGPP